MVFIPSQFPPGSPGPAPALPNPGPVPDYYHTHELKHFYGGNGYYFLDEVDRDGYGFIRVTDKAFREVKVLRRDMISKWVMRHVRTDNGEVVTREFPIDDDMLVRIQRRREALATGIKMVRNGHIVKGPNSV